MLANPSIEGWLTITPKLVRGDGLKLTSAKWNGKISLLIDLVTGRFDLLLSGAMQRYLIPGLGIVDVITDLHVVPGPNNKGSHVVGTAKAWVRRLDNSFFRELTGGLPSLTTNLERGNDGIVHFTNLQIYSPKLRLSGAGQRFKDGTFHIVAAGRQAKYGPLKMVLDGHIERPRLDLFFDRPERRARASPACGCCSIPPRRASTTAPAAARSSAPSPATGRSFFRATLRRSSRSQRLMPAERMRPASCALIRGGSPAA